MKNLNYLMNHNLHQIFKRLFSIYIKKHLEKTVNPAIKIYINKSENRIMFKIKTGYYFDITFYSCNNENYKETPKVR